jgi:Protein of unknown function (DUF3142)
VTLAKNKKTILFLFTVLLILAFTITGAVREKQPLQKKVMLWAWERPEQLGFIETGKAGVAYLAESFNLRGNDVVVKPRLQPLIAPDGTELIAVIRIDTDRITLPAFSEKQSHRIVYEITELSKRESISGVQIDFDALVSERSFYQQLLQQVRKKIPAATTLSITALASWCMFDDWIKGLPVDEAVPMLFRMGNDKEMIIRYLRDHNNFPAELCRNSIGVSTDESTFMSWSQKRVYIFNPHAWTSADLSMIVKAHPEFNEKRGVLWQSEHILSLLRQ